MSTLSEQVEHQLVDYIMQNKMLAGSKLPTEVALCTLLKVSRGILREAIKRLVSRNVLQVRQGSGIYVASSRLGIAPDPLGFTFIEDKQKLIRDLLEIRLMIEPRIAQMAAMMATAVQIEEIKVLADEVEAEIKANINHTEKDILFHSKIAESTHNLVVPSLLPIIQQAIMQFIDMTHSDLKQETIETHRAIIQALQARDPIAAHDAMMLHLIYNRNRLTKKE